MHTFRRTKNTLFYFLTPAIISLALFMAFRDYSSLNAFISSCANVWTIIALVVTLVSVFKALRTLNGLRLYKKFVNSIDPSKYMIVFDGFPGAGKTSTTSEYCVILATLMWEKIQFEYWLLRNTQKKWRGKKKAELDFEDNKTAHEFWTAETGFYPCLYTNIDNYDTSNKKISGMTVDGEKVKYFTFEMLNQKDPIIYGSVIHLEEVGDWAGNEFSQNKAELGGVSKIARFLRHYGFSLTLNDQDSMNIFINLRRSICQKQLMLKQKWTCRPKLLLAIQGICKRYIQRKDYKDMPRLAAFLFRLDKLIKTIGFRKYKSIIAGGTDIHATGEKAQKFNFCIPSILLASYDDRYKRTSYPCSLTADVDFTNDTHKPLPPEVYHQ